VFDFAVRRRRLGEMMEAEGVAALFLGPSADLEYLTGIERQLPSFSDVSYAHHWVIGGFFRPGADPVFLLPRMFATFDLRVEPEGEVIVVGESDDGFSAFERVARGIGGGGTVAVGDRIWAETALHLGRIVGYEHLRTGSQLVNDLRRIKTGDELAAMGRAIATVELAMAAVTPLTVTGISMGELAELVEQELRRAGSRCPSFTTHILTGFGEGELDSGEATARTPVTEGTSIMFDFGGVVDGYCSDFGRTIYCGEPPADYLEAYEVMLAAQDAGRRALVAGAPARDANTACRGPLEEAGFGEYFRHRMGHGIGLNVHERPFLSSEDETVLEPGMVFTDEPSINIRGRYSLRIEDMIVCQEGGGRMLNTYPPDLVVNG
jgi:Xaa-Pro aminopeptidase